MGGNGWFYDRDTTRYKAPNPAKMSLCQPAFLFFFSFSLSHLSGLILHPKLSTEWVITDGFMAVIPPNTNHQILYRCLYPNQLFYLFFLSLSLIFPVLVFIPHFRTLMGDNGWF